MSQDAAKDLTAEQEAIRERINNFIAEIKHHIDNNHWELSSTWVLDQVRKLTNV